MEQEVTEKPSHTVVAAPVSSQVTASEPVTIVSKGQVTEEKVGPVQLDSNSENVFQEVFLADFSIDVFFPEQSPDETIQGNENGNNSAKPLRR
jgi:catalase